MSEAFLLTSVYVITNLETTEPAFIENLTLDTIEIRWYGVYIDVSQTKYGIHHNTSNT